jgi:flagellar hook-length control protein FliK
MNMTISFTNSDSFGKQKFSANESADAESKTEDFAALFNVPVFTPPVNAPVKFVKPENKGEIKIDAPSVESNQDAPATNSPIKPLPTPVNLTQEPGFIAPNYEAGLDEKFAESSLTIKNQVKPNFAEETFNRNILKKDAGFQLFTTHQNAINNQLVSILNYEPAPVLNGHTVFTQNQAVNVQINQFSSEVNQEKVSSDVPKLFNEVSNIVKADNSIKTNSTPDLMSEQKIVEQIKQNISGESGQNLNQSETESPKNGKELKVRETFSGQIFDNFLNPVSKEQKIVENVPQTNNLNGKVFEQIEPRILELAAFNRTGSEKRILKMRLNPADLGAVEITLEKSSTGKINAHFQTETEPARQILNESLSQLRDSLQNSGWQVGDLEISCNSSSSNGDERRENQSQQFGTTEDQPVATTTFDGNSKGEDDKQSRLVNLRA